MFEVEELEVIVRRFRSEGRGVREAVQEWQRQAREALRERESAILIAAELPNAGPGLREVAQQIRDHRECGHYTTNG